MSSITTREFVIDDYDEAVAVWNLVEGVEVAEGDSKEQIRAYLARNPGLVALRRTARSWARCSAVTMAGVA